MFDSCFLPFRLHYSETKDLAVGDVVNSGFIAAGGQLWKIVCYPRGYDDDDMGNYVSIYLDIISNFNGEVEVILEAFLLDKDGAPSFIHAERLLHVYSYHDDSRGWPRFVKRSFLKTPYVVDGWVTIVLGLRIVRDNLRLAVPSSDIGDHLGRLLDCTDGSDVSFVVGGKTFAAHRAVLAARSPVFKAELLGSMAEATMSHITLNGIEPAVFEVLLRFMYTDVLPQDDDLGHDSLIDMYQHLLAAADRYAMDRLKMMCAIKLWENVSVDTVAVILTCAEMYNCPELKANCIAFFVDKDFKMAVLTEGYVQLVQKFPSIMAELRERVEEQRDYHMSLIV